MGSFTIIIIGFIFGILMRYSRLNQYDTIAGMATFDNFTVAKTILTILSFGGFFFAVLISVGLATFHIKPLFILSILIGGLIFGIGMAVLGYCPGTLPISLGEGSIDALFGIIGGLLGGIAYTDMADIIPDTLGKDFGYVSLYSVLSGSDSFYITLASIIGICFLLLAFWLNKIDRKKNNIRSIRWFISGIGIAILNVILLFWLERGIGASAAYPYSGDEIIGFTQTNYFFEVEENGLWELKFLCGAFIAGLIYSLTTRTFHFTILHKHWTVYKGINPFARIICSLAGGFILIFGARIANGCTSGHIITGGMQFAFSSYLFAVIAFVSFIATGRFFYHVPAHLRQKAKKNRDDFPDPF